MDSVGERPPRGRSSESSYTTRRDESVAERRRPGGPPGRARVGRRARAPTQRRLHPGRRPRLRGHRRVRPGPDPNAPPGPDGARGDAVHAVLRRQSRVRAFAQRADDRPAHRAHVHPREQGASRGTGAAAGPHHDRGRRAPEAGLRHRHLRQVGAGRTGHGGRARAPRLPGVLRLLRSAARALLLSGVPASQRGRGPAAQPRARGAAQPRGRPRRGARPLQPGRDRGRGAGLPAAAPRRALLPLPPVHHPARRAAGARRRLRAVPRGRPQHLPGDAVRGAALRRAGHAARDLRGDGHAAGPRRRPDPGLPGRAGARRRHDRLLHQRQRAVGGGRQRPRVLPEQRRRCAGSSATSTRAGSACP